MNNKISALLGFASKAGKLSYGMDAAISAILKRKSRLVLITSDVSPKSKKEITFHCEKHKIEFAVLDDCKMETLSHAVGKKCGIIAVNDDSFADGLREEIK